MPTTTHGMSSDAIEQLIAQHVADAMMAYEANTNTRNGSHDEASGIAGRTVHTARGCMYKEFMNCQPYTRHSSVIHHQSYQTPVHHPSSQAPFPQLDLGLAVPSFLPLDDPIASLHKEGHVARQCTKTKRPRNSAWFKEKAMLAEALESGVALDEEQMPFLTDDVDTVTTGQAYQELVTTTTFQTDDLDAFNYDCDEAPLTSAVFMAKLFVYDLNVLSEVQTHDNYLDNHVNDYIMQGMQYSEQPHFNNKADVDIASDSNIISCEQYLKATKYLVAKCIVVDKMNKIVNESLTAELERYKGKIKLFEERRNCDLNDREKYIDSQLREVIVDRNAKVANFQNQIHSLKLQLSTTVESHKTLSTTVDVLKQESKAKEDKYLKEIIDLEKEKKSLDDMENDRLLELIISQDLVHTAVNSLAEIVDYQNMEKSYLDEDAECVQLKAELSKKNDMIEKIVYNEFLKRYARMENRCRSNHPVASGLGCSKHMTGNRSHLINFVSKFIETVRFRNDHVAAIRGSEDYEIGNITISRVYYVEWLGHNLFLVGQFCDSVLEVAFLELQLMTLGTISSGLMQNPPSISLYVSPTKNDWDLMFLQMSDEYFNPPPSVVSLVPATAAPRHADTTGSPSSTSIDQAAPSANTSSTIQETRSLVIFEGV
uniref:Integrase, catalytic region, zinc finger, CCHC-type, peptidase aspartic, catalytic n=1 Tax=Tanacetum cinerariifolium TaxID=118510 RepID=A0A699GKF3_TANCI|nr:integrase, catalytic region, zinc finger, CCHC-type, peptidase aspartic, catalytic [Tanacetum cinerariifolium]